MKKKILGLIGATLIIALMVLNIQFTTNVNSSSFKLPTLASQVKQTNANAEEGGTCMGGSYVSYKAKTGSTCICNNNFVTSQTCESGGNGCTEIKCN